MKFIKNTLKHNDYELKRSYFIDLSPDKQRFIADLILAENEYYIRCCKELIGLIKTEPKLLLHGDDVYNQMQKFIKTGLTWRQKSTCTDHELVKNLDLLFEKIPRLGIAMQVFCTPVKIPLENKCEIFKNVLNAYKDSARMIRDFALDNKENAYSKPILTPHNTSNRKCHDIVRQNCEIIYDTDQEKSQIKIKNYGLVIDIENYDLRNLPDWQYLKLQFLNKKNKNSPGYWNLSFCKSGFLSVESFK